MFEQVQVSEYEAINRFLMHHYPSKGKWKDALSMSNHVDEVCVSKVKATFPGDNAVLATAELKSGDQILTIYGCELLSYAEYAELWGEDEYAHIIWHGPFAKVRLPYGSDFWIESEADLVMLYSLVGDHWSADCRLKGRAETGRQEG